MDILEIAKEIEFNAKAEADAVLYYTELLKTILASNLDEEDKQVISAVINEIISDELNHQAKLKTLYIQLTGIQENGD